MWAYPTARTTEYSKKLNKDKETNKMTRGLSEAQKKIYAMVSKSLIGLIEDAINEGKALPWARPWRRGKVVGAISYATKQPYDLTNQFMLGFRGVWVSWTEIVKQGAKLKDNPRVGYVVERFKKEFKTEIENDEGEIEEKVRKFYKLRYFKVYNADDVEGLKPLNLKEIESNHADPIAEGEVIVRDYEARSGVRIFRERSSNEAYYNPVRDEIHVPSIKQYKKAKRAEYYSTLFHEMTHSTGHSTRLNRLNSMANTAFGSEAYSQEELVAEMGAAMLLATAGIDTEGTLRNNAAYLQNWLSALKNDVTLAYWASRCAEKAVSYILYGAEGYKGEDETEKAAEDKSAAESEDKSETSEDKSDASVKDSVAQPETKSKGKKSSKTKDEGAKPSAKVEDKRTPFKASYNIRTAKGLKEVEGYVFTTGNHRYGVTNKWINKYGTACKGDWWTVTELTTGYSTNCTGKTRREAIDKLFELIKNNGEALYKAIKMYTEGGGEDSNPTINPITVYMTAAK